jgi:hypothetical protein
MRQELLWHVKRQAVAQQLTSWQQLWLRQPTKAVDDLSGDRSSRCCCLSQR